MQYNSSCDSECDGLSVNASRLLCSSGNKEDVAMHYGSTQGASEVTLGTFQDAEHTSILLHCFNTLYEIQPTPRNNVLLRLT
jgi:hypothetical protein